MEYRVSLIRSNTFNAFFDVRVFRCVVINLQDHGLPVSLESFPEKTSRLPSSKLTYCVLNIVRQMLANTSDIAVKSNTFSLRHGIYRCC